MNKNTLSLSVSRQLAGDFPVGDPFGGAAYGERNMPFIIAPAFAAVGTAVAAGAGAMAVAGAVVTAVGAVATVAGIGMTVVGAITGNESLMKIGGYVGLAGGVAGLAGMGVSAMASTASAAAATTATTNATINAGVEGAKGAITPTFQSAGGVAMDATAKGAQSVMPGFGSQAAGNALYAPVSASGAGLSGATQAAALNGTGVNLAGNVASSTGAASTASVAPTVEPGFFSSMLEGAPTSAKWDAIGIIGKGVVGMMGDDGAENDKRKLDYQIMESERKWADQNTPIKTGGLLDPAKLAAAKAKRLQAYQQTPKAPA